MCRPTRVTVGVRFGEESQQPATTGFYGERTLGSAGRALHGDDVLVELSAANEDDSDDGLAAVYELENAGDSEG